MHNQNESKQSKYAFVSKGLGQVFRMIKSNATFRFIFQVSIYMMLQAIDIPIQNLKNIKCQVS